MKIRYAFVFVAAVVVLLSSCSVEKAHYLRGYYFERNGEHKNPDDNAAIAATGFKTTPVKSVAPVPFQHPATVVHDSAPKTFIVSPFTVLRQLPHHAGEIVHACKKMKPLSRLHTAAKAVTHDDKTGKARMNGFVLSSLIFLVGAPILFFFLALAGLSGLFDIFFTSLIGVYLLLLISFILALAGLIQIVENPGMFKGKFIAINLLAILFFVAILLLTAF